MPYDADSDHGTHDGSTLPGASGDSVLSTQRSASAPTAVLSAARGPSWPDRTLAFALEEPRIHWNSARGKIHLHSCEKQVRVIENTGMYVHPYGVE